MEGRAGRVTREQLQAQVKTDPRAVASAWSLTMVSTSAIKVTMWRDGREDRITVQAKGGTQ